jgi:hypothetical protein
MLSFNRPDMVTATSVIMPYDVRSIDPAENARQVVNAFAGMTRPFGPFVQGGSPPSGRMYRTAMNRLQPQAQPVQQTQPADGQPTQAQVTQAAQKLATEVANGKTVAVQSDNQKTAADVVNTAQAMLGGACSIGRLGSSIIVTPKTGVRVSMPNFPATGAPVLTSSQFAAGFNTEVGHLQSLTMQVR